MKFIPEKEIRIKDSIDDYFNYKRATETLSSSSIRNRRYELNRFLKYCSAKKIKFVSEIDRKTIITYLGSINISKSSKSIIMYILSSYMDYLVNEGLMLENLVETIEKPKYYIPKTDYLVFEEIERLFRYEAENGKPKTIDRNLLLFSLFSDICLRVSEAVNLKLEDVRLDAKEIWITRKRHKVDNIPLNDDLVSKFQNWYAVRPLYKGNDLPWVFLSSHGKQLKPRQVHNIVSNALKRAGIFKRKMGPHLLRHSGASFKARSGENLIMIQYLLGHENLNTTRRYLHFNWEDLKDMVERSSIASSVEK